MKSAITALSTAITQESDWLTRENEIWIKDPVTCSHGSLRTRRFEFIDTIHNKTVVYNGPVFSPRLSETPLAISSPVKGENWSFTSLSTNAYHFDGLYIRNGKLLSPQRFAWDN